MVRREIFKTYVDPTKLHVLKMNPETFNLILLKFVEKILSGILKYAFYCEMKLDEKYFFQKHEIAFTYYETQRSPYEI